MLFNDVLQKPKNIKQPSQRVANTIDRFQNEPAFQSVMSYVDGKSHTEYLIHPH